MTLIFILTVWINSVWRASAVAEYHSKPLCYAMYYHLTAEGWRCEVSSRVE